MYILIRKCKKILLLITIVLLVNSPSAFSIDKPQAVVHNPDWDFGYVPQKSKVSYTFYLTNSGSASLNVAKIKSGCSCTSNSKIEKPIPPGDSAAVTITFNSGRFHKTVKKTTTIFTDDPDSSVLFLNIAAKVYKKKETPGDIIVNPQKITIKIDEKGLVTETDSLEILNNSSDSVKVNILHTSVITLDKFDIPLYLNPNEKVYPVLNFTRESLPDKLKGESIIFGFVGRDTTIVTIPIEVKK